MEQTDARLTRFTASSNPDDLMQDESEREHGDAQNLNTAYLWIARKTTPKEPSPSFSFS